MSEVYNQDLFQMALARAAALSLVREKQAIVPGGADPAAAMGGGMPPAGGDPAAMGAAPPGMPPGAPPGGDPAMGGAGMTDPALAAAGGDQTGMIAQVVQQVLAAQGGGAGGKPGAPGAKGGKPDVAMELAKLNENVYKLSLIVMSIAGTVHAEIPMGAAIGQPPETVDPALAQASQAPIPGTGDPAAAGGAPGAAPADPAAAAGGAKQAAEGLAALSGFGEEPEGEEGADVLGAFKQEDDREAIAKSARAVRETLGLDPEEGLQELLDEPFRVEKVAAPPARIGDVFRGESAGPVRDQAPLMMARMVRQRALGR